MRSCARPTALAVRDIQVGGVRLATKWGLILGLAICVWTLALHGLGYYTTRIGAGQVADLIATIFPVAAIVMALRARRRSDAITLRGAVGLALATGLSSLIVTIPFFWWYHHVVNPQWAEFLVAHQRETMLAAGRSIAEIEQSVAAKLASTTDGAQILGAIVGTSAISTLTGLVTGLAMRRPGDATPTQGQSAGIGTFVLAVIACEAIPIALLVGVVFFYGIAGGTEAPEKFARSVALWFGPIAGALTVVAFAWAINRGRPNTVRRGLWLGLAVAALDLAIVAAQGESFRMLLLFSAIGKSAAGAVGGYLATRKSATGS